MEIKVIYNSLNEGIDIDSTKRIVSFNPNHEKLVNTSVKRNPRKNDVIHPYDNVEVWSIFKRNKKGDPALDGNPLIYALKGEHDWKFKTDQDRQIICDRIEAIIKKFARKVSYNTVILVPSTNALNRFIGDIVEKYTKWEVLDDVLRKMYVEEVILSVLKKDSPFRKYYGEEYFERKFKKLQRYLDKMGGETASFVRHEIPDQEMRNVIDKTLKVSNEDYHDEINGKDILIIDDIISRGASIKESIDIIYECYDPKSITVLTLLSKL